MQEQELPQKEQQEKRIDINDEWFKTQRDAWKFSLDRDQVYEYLAIIESVGPTVAQLHALTQEMRQLRLMAEESLAAAGEDEHSDLLDDIRARILAWG